MQLVAAALVVAAAAMDTVHSLPADEPNPLKQRSTAATLGTGKWRRPIWKRLLATAAVACAVASGGPAYGVTDAVAPHADAPAAADAADAPAVCGVGTRRDVCGDLGSEACAGRFASLRNIAHSRGGADLEDEALLPTYDSGDKGILGAVGDTLQSGLTWVRGEDPNEDPNKDPVEDPDRGT